MTPRGLVTLTSLREEINLPYCCWHHHRLLAEASFHFSARAPPKTKGLFRSVPSRGFSLNSFSSSPLWSRKGESVDEPRVLDVRRHLISQSSPAEKISFVFHPAGEKQVQERYKEWGHELLLQNLLPVRWSLSTEVLPCSAEK
jgi:hypothetical protein